MPKTSQPELDPSHPQLLKKTEELRIHLLSNDGIRERVSLRAYELYERRGCEYGHDLENWAEAENEILSPLIEQELKLSRETSRGDGQKRDASETAEPGITVVPKKKPISGANHKAEAAHATKTKTRF